MVGILAPQATDHPVRCDLARSEAQRAGGRRRARAAAAPAAASDVESDSAEMLLAEEMALVARASSQELPVHEIVDQPPEPAPPPAEPPAPQPPPYDAALVKSRSLRD